jgi:low affinity Fe/Cu permease
MKIYNKAFETLAEWTAKNLGSSYSFASALILVVLWASTGPFFNFSQTWQLVINTGTTIATFLMVFLLQNSQNRTTAELHALVKAQTANTEELGRIMRRMAIDNRRVLTKLESIEDDIEELAEDDEEVDGEQSDK